MEAFALVLPRPVLVSVGRWSGLIDPQRHLREPYQSPRRARSHALRFAAKCAAREPRAARQTQDWSASNPAKSSGPRNLTPTPAGVKHVAINDEERARAQMYRNAQVVPLFGSAKSRGTALCHSLLGQSTVQE